MSWDPYLDLQAGVLRNRLGITDKAELAQAEAELTGYRLIELQLNPLPGRVHRRQTAPPRRHHRDLVAQIEAFIHTGGTNAASEGINRFRPA